MLISEALRLDSSLLLGLRQVGNDSLAGFELSSLYRTSNLQSFLNGGLELPSILRSTALVLGVYLCIALRNNRIFEVAVISLSNNISYLRTRRGLPILCKELYP